MGLSAGLGSGLFALSMLLVAVTTVESLGCSDQGLCCSGKNVTCKAPGPRTGSASRSCFCDEYCALAGDCCKDYADYCRPVDCLMGDWERWTPCDKECGWGQRSRKRAILVSPRNGGKACDVDQEKGTCYGWSCKKPRNLHTRRSLSETAKIIPAKFGSWRKNKLYDPYSDIRRNLFNHHSANEIVNKKPYCAYFRVNHSKHSCRANAATPWSKQLRMGQVVCVECQQFSMRSKLGSRCRGDGLREQETRWAATTIPGCHGSWEMISDHKDCSCDPNSDTSFIFL